MDNKQILFWLLDDAEKYADENDNEHYGFQKDNLEEKLNHLKNRNKIELPSSLPKAKDELISVLRKHFNDDVNIISLILNHYFPEDFIFYRVSKLEDEIFKGFDFLELELPFSKIGNNNFENYLKLNVILLNIFREKWPDLKNPQKRISYFLYKGLGNLFLEKSDYNRYWIMVTNEEHFIELDFHDEDQWSGRKEMQKGDLVFMYRTAPRKAITDIYSVTDDPCYNQFWYWGFGVNIKRLSRIKDITFSEMRADPIIGQWNLIRRQFQGISTEGVPHSIYNELLKKLPGDIKQKFNLKPEPVAKVGYSGQFISEQEFEEEFVIPLLKRWGFQYHYQYPQIFHVGCQKLHCRVDFHIRDEKGHLTLFEDKLRIINDLDLKLAVGQAKSYALMLGLSSFVVASPEGIWIYKLNKNTEELVMNFNSNEIQNHDAEIRRLLLNIR